MEDHTKPLSGLSGTPRPQRAQGTLEKVLAACATWAERTQITAPNNNCPQLCEEVTTSFEDVQSLLKDIPVEEEHIARLLETREEFKTLPGYRYLGLFVSGMMKQAGNPHYRLQGIEDVDWVGVGLHGVIVEAETFGNNAGSFNMHTTCKTKVPEHQPRIGTVLVGQKFGDRTGYGSGYLQIHGGSYGDRTGRYAHRMIVLDGVFEGDVGYNTVETTICGGIFNGWIGHDAGIVSIFNGTFNNPAGAPTSAYIYRGDFGRDWWTGKNEHSHREVCGTVIEDTDTNTGKKRYKVTPWIPIETSIERTMRMLMDSIPKSMLNYFPELKELG